MAEEDFNELVLLSKEDILKGLHPEVDKVIAEAESLHTKIDARARVIAREVKRNIEERNEFWEDFCDYHTENRVWYKMYKGGGEYLVPELARSLNLSISNAYKILESLRRRNLVKEVGNWQYKAFTPEEYISEKRIQEKKDQNGVNRLRLKRHSQKLRITGPERLPERRKEA